MFIIIIFITITQQPEQDRWAENQPTAGLSSLNEYENEYENGMRKSETELFLFIHFLKNHCLVEFQCYVDIFFFSFKNHEY